MKPNNALYHYQERKMEPFGWILIFYIITIVFFFSIFMIFGPIKVFLDYFNFWSAFLLPFIPIGIWLAIKTFHYARGVIWHNNHNAVYHFYRDHIECIQWKETYKSEPKKSRIDVDKIEKIIVSQYIVNEYRTKHGTKHIDRNYIFYIIHSTSSKKELFLLPLPNKDDQMNIWLTYFKELGLPVYFYNPILYRTDQRYFLNDDQRLEILDKENDLVQLPYNGDWKQLKKELRNNWNYYSKIELEPTRLQATDLDSEEAQSQPNTPENTSLTPSRQRKNPPLTFWLNVTLIVYGIMIGATFSLVELAKLEYIAADHSILIVITFLIGSLLYFFLLRSYLRWYYMLILAIKVFFFGVITAISFEDSIGVQVGDNILAMSILFPFIIWLPYLVVKLIHTANEKQ